MRHRLAPSVALSTDDAAGTAVLETERGPVRFASMDAGQLAVLRCLAGDGATEAEVVAARGADAGVEGTAWVHLTLDRLLQIGVLDRVVGDPPIAVIEVVGNRYRASGRALPDATVRLSRFAYLHADAGRLVVESPRALSRLAFVDHRGPAVLGAIADAVHPDRVRWPPGVDGEAGRLLLTTLFQEGFLEPGEPGDVSAIPEAQALAEWGFSDLLFHARSRQGRHRNPYGATYRFEGVRPPLPAVKDVPDGERLALPRPDLEAIRKDDVPFAEVLESRRSLRMPGPEPLTIGQLGEFLFRAARVRGRRGTEHEEVSNRPYPGGGADYELEIYPVVHRVDGVEPGLYHYDPLGHALTKLADAGGLVTRLAEETVAKAPPGTRPDVLLAVTARIQRLTYKYESIPYAVALKDLGVLYQTFYLTATAMGLAPCAVGGGDSDLFAAAAGLSPFVEPQIGEFLLNTRHPDEVAGTPLPGAPRRD